MKNYIITTDSNSDLLDEYIKEKQIGIIPHYYDLEGKIYGEEEVLAPKVFYDKMREGLMPTTMASNPHVIKETFQRYIDKGLDVLHISFSSALSSGCSNVTVGARECMEENPDVKIIVIDSLNVSLAQGMIIMKAIELKEEGKTIEETVDWIEEHKLDFCVHFTVDDLHHLHRGGRVSKASAVIGSMMNVKPILYVNHEGALLSLSTIRGRKRSLMTLVSNMNERMGKYKDYPSTVCIVHGDALEDALFLESLVRKEFNVGKIIINTISPSIGAHSGPGAIGLCFMGEKR